MSDKFKDRLLYAMELRHINAAELSRRTGLSKAQISQYTNGIYEAKQEALYKLSIVLKVSVDWLMGHDNDLDNVDEKRIADEEKLLCLVELYYGKEAVKLLSYFVKLTDSGKTKAVDTVYDLTEISRYRNDDYPDEE